MPQIALMIKQLDANPAKKQEVFVYSVRNGDPVAMQQILQELFQKSTSQAYRSSQNQTSPLGQRSQNSQRTSSPSSSFGTSGFGGSRSSSQGAGQP